MGTMGLWTVFPSPGGAAPSHGPLELGKQELRWHRTCPCTALLSHSAPQTLRVPPSLIPEWAVDAFQALKCAFCLFCVPWTTDASGARFPRVPGSPPVLIRTRLLLGRALGLLCSSFGLHGGGDSRSWDKGTVTSMARAPSPLYGTGQARGQQLQEHGQDLECFWENAGAGRTCPIPAGDTDTEGTCCFGPTGRAGPSSPAALPEGAPGSFLVLVNKSLLTPEAASTQPPVPMSSSTGCTGPAVVSVPFPRDQGEFFGGLGVFLLLLRKCAICQPAPLPATSLHSWNFPRVTQLQLGQGCCCRFPPSQGIGKMEKGEKSLGCLKSSCKCFSLLLLSAKTGLPVWHEPSPCPFPKHPKTTAPAPCFGGCRDFPPGGTWSILPVDPWAKPYPNPTISMSLSSGFWLVWGVRARTVQWGRGDTPH